MRGERTLTNLWRECQLWSHLESSLDIPTIQHYLSWVRSPKILSFRSLSGGQIQGGKEGLEGTLLSLIRECVGNPAWVHIVEYSTTVRRSILEVPSNTDRSQSIVLQKKIRKYHIRAQNNSKIFQDLSKWRFHFNYIRRVAYRRMEQEQELEIEEEQITKASPMVIVCCGPRGMPLCLATPRNM